MKKIIGLILLVGCMLSIVGCSYTETFLEHRDYQPNVNGTYTKSFANGYNSSITFNGDNTFNVSQNGITSSQNGFYEETENNITARSSDWLDTFVFEKTPNGKLIYNRSKSSYNTMNTENFMDGEILSRSGY